MSASTQASSPQPQAPLLPYLHQELCPRPIFRQGWQGGASARFPSLMEVLAAPGGCFVRTLFKTLSSASGLACPHPGSSCQHSRFPQHHSSPALKINLNKQEEKGPVPPAWYICASKAQTAGCSPSPSQTLNWLNIHGCPFARTPEETTAATQTPEQSQGCHQEISLMRIKNNSIKKPIPERCPYLFLRDNPPLFCFCFFKH